MIFKECLPLNEHPEIFDLHAPFSPSQYHWLNYDRDRLIQYWDNKDAQIIGTKVHSIAADLINAEYYFREKGLDYHISLRGKDSFSQHVNFAIKNQMQPEVAVKYSDICFGHADALVFNIPKRTLLISDLKTGKTPGHMEQLETYAAIFVAEYSNELQYVHHIDMNTIDIQLRIFQFNECLLANPPADYIINEVLRKIRVQHEILSEELARRNK